MNLSAIVEVAIGMIFVWIVLSLSTIQLQEWIITGILKRRSKDLEKTIRGMLADPNLKAQFYDHPIIRGITATKGKSPSYIPAQQFALSLFDIATTAGTESSLIQQGLYSVRSQLEQAKKKDKNEAALEALNALTSLARSAAATETGKSVTNVTLKLLKTKVNEFSATYPKYKPAVDLVMAQAVEQMAEVKKVLNNQPPPTGDAALAQLRSGIAALSVVSPGLNQTLTSLLLNVEEYAGEHEAKLGLARKSVEKWFDDSMDRISGAFKRYTQVWAVVIGFVLALVLNVDSIGLITYLWREPSVRQALADQASKFQLPQEEVESNPYKAMQDFREQFVGLSLPIGWTMKLETDPLFQASDCKLFPKGNEFFGISIFDRCISPSQPDHSTNIGFKFFGIVLTALAAAQGAPFWFDMLKRLVNLRGTGANPAEKEAAK